MSSTGISLGRVFRNESSFRTPSLSFLLIVFSTADLICPSNASIIP
uniref:Putative BPI/LBP family protein At1g04970 isoform X1 n=1 Tax=Rhizophora mucronata TaxID=61149 RepID=A0A2P2JWC1_RHIMU